MELETLVTTMVQDKQLMKHCFILTWEIIKTTYFTPSDNTLKRYLLDVYNSKKEVIDYPEVMGDRIVLITVKEADQLNYTVIAGRNFTVGSVNFTVVPVKPVAARVSMIVTGIPRIVLKRNGQATRSAFSKLKALRSVFNLEFDCNSIDIWVSGTTTDMVAVRRAFAEDNVTVELHGFKGTLIYKHAKDLYESHSLSAEYSVLNW